MLIIFADITSCRDDYTVVASLDLGTTYSGFAFSTRQNPLDIHHVDKVPTCLLLSPNKEFVGFGNDAIRIYTELVKTGQHTGHYFLQKFKMDLYENEVNTKINRRQHFLMLLSFLFVCSSLRFP